MGLGRRAVAGLLLIYVPVSRHPATLLTMGMALLAAGLIPARADVVVGSSGVLGIGSNAVGGNARARRGPAAARARPQRTVEFAGGTRFHAFRLQGGKSRAPTLDRNSPAQPAAAHGKQRAMRGRLPFIIGLLLSFALIRAAAGVEDRSASDIRFLCVLAPENRMKDWPLGGGKYLPIDADEFERLVAAMKPQGSKIPPAPSAAITSAQYAAKLMGERLIGRATLDVTLAGTIKADAAGTLQCGDSGGGVGLCPPLSFRKKERG